LGKQREEFEKMDADYDSIDRNVKNGKIISNNISNREFWRKASLFLLVVIIGVVDLSMIIYKIKRATSSTPSTNVPANNTTST